MIHLKLQLDWLPNAQFAGILYAHHLGWYEDVGINLEIIPWEAHTNQMDMLQSNENYIVSTEDNLLIRARAENFPVKAISSMMQYSGIGWMSLKESGLISLKDLRGKKLGIHPDGELAIKIALANQNMTSDDLVIKDVGFDYIDLLVNKKIDAMQCLIMVEPLEIKQKGFDVNIIRGADLGYEVYAQVIGTTDRLIEQYPNELIDFLRVTYAGWRSAFAEPNHCSTIVVNHYLKNSEVELQKQMLIAMQPLFEGEVGMKRLGCMKPDRWEKTISYLKNNNMIALSPGVKEVMTNKLMEQAYVL